MKRNDIELGIAVVWIITVCIIVLEGIIISPYLENAECNDNLGNSEYIWTQDELNEETICCRDLLIDNRVLVDNILMGEKHWHKECFRIDG